MRLLQQALMSFGGSCIGVVFVFWGLFIWEGDHRWGETAGLFLVAGIVSIIGGALVELRPK